MDAALNASRLSGVFLRTLMIQVSDRPSSSKTVPERVKSQVSFV